MRLLVDGISNFKDYEYFEERMAKYYATTSRVLITDLKGTPALAARWARERSIPSDIKRVNRYTYGQQALTYAYQEMIFETQRVVVFWDGSCTDQLELMDMASKKKVPMEVIMLRGLSIYG